MSVWVCAVCANMVFLIRSDETGSAAFDPAVNNIVLLLDLFHPPISPTVYF